MTAKSPRNDPGSDGLLRVELAVEAVLFAAAVPVSKQDLWTVCAALGEAGKDALEQVLERLQERYAQRAIELVHSAGGYRFRVREQYASSVHAAQPERPARLSRALLETLAIIAYQQPVTRAQIEAVRGVAVSSGIMRTLQEREWVRVVGHKETPGRPALYATTRVFLDDLGLTRLDDLPPLDAIRELADTELALTGDGTPAPSSTLPNPVAETVDPAEAAPPEVDGTTPEAR